MPDERANWILLIIRESGGAVEGVTRLQKYAFLVAKRVIGNQEGFYNDWVASHYGPYSHGLAMDIQKLVKVGLIKESTKTNQYGHKVGVLALEPDALHLIDKMRESYPKESADVKRLISMYKDKALIELLHHAYYLYPEYAVNSKIKAQVGRQIYESDSYLNPQYDYSNDQD